MPVAGPLLPGYSQFEFSNGAITHVTYCAGDRRNPPLLLMPELAGIAPGLLLFADRLIAAGFQVYIPWLFGPVGRRSPLRNGLRLCISREFANLRQGVSAPVTYWLRALATEISLRSGGGNVGVIGMCLTGAFAIPLVLNPAVVAAVAAQPSVPLSPLFAAFGLGDDKRKSGLNIGAGDLAAARSRLDSGEAELLAVRCRPDRICPQAKLERLQAEFSTGFHAREYGSPEWRNSAGRRPHALFTKEYRLAPEAAADHPSRQAFSDLLSFFNQHLRKAGADRTT